LRREFGAIQHGAASTLPWTASREEVWLDEHSTLAVRLSGLVVAVDVPDSAFREMLKAALVSAGATVAESQREAADFVLVDADVPSAERIEAIRAVVRETAPAKVLGLTAWPTHELSQAASEWGVTDLIPKLDMLTLFERMANGRGGSCRSLASQ
jgi:DNA-binding NarL/FixJ family response regulator